MCKVLNFAPPPAQILRASTRALSSSIGKLAFAQWRPFIGGFMLGGAVACGSAWLYVQLDARAKEIPSILKYGVPFRGPDVYVYKNHALAYDQAHKTPLWVGEHLTKRCVQGEANRRKSRFEPDPVLQRTFSASNDDYWHSGWSRGHMAAAGNHKFSQEAMNQTFYLTNIVPQDIENNNGYWNLIEMYCRDLTKKFDDVFVISGPLYMPNLYENGKTMVKYEVIGHGRVAVPTHLFKVVVAEKQGQYPAVAAFVVPNAPLPTKRPLTDFQVPLEKLEDFAGLLFLKKLDKSRMTNLCTAKEECRLPDWKEFEIFRSTRSLQEARSLKELDRNWANVLSKGLNSDDKLKNIYAEKAKQLSLATPEAKLGHESVDVTPAPA